MTRGGTVQHDIDEYLRDDAGSPLGVGMPSGRTLRADGQSHYAAWQALLRLDPCVFCAGPGGTVDHLEPRSRPVRGVGGSPHGWQNLAGACGGCNGAKRDSSLLAYLHRRRTRVRRRRGSTVRAGAQVAASSAHGRTPAGVRLDGWPSSPPSRSIPCRWTTTTG